LNTNRSFHVKLGIFDMASQNLRLRTPRLELVAGTVEMLEADLAGREQLAKALGVEVPESWPPVNWEPKPIRFLIDWMKKRPDADGWFAWYCILSRTDFQSVERTSGNSAASSTPPLRKTAEKSDRPLGNLSHGTLIGGLGFLGPPNSVGETAIGYSLLANYHRQGLCPEGVSALVDWAFGHPELQMLLIRTHPQHRPSIRVAEKLGFQFVGPDKELDTIDYGLERAGWKK
jgi:ribosomal-protein-alanine N-acetyltransferase